MKTNISEQIRTEIALFCCGFIDKMIWVYFWSLFDENSCTNNTDFETTVCKQTLT